MNKYGIIGFGALGNQILNFLLEQKIQLTNITLFDDHQKGKNFANCHPFNAYKEKVFSGLNFYIGLGYKHLETKSKIIDELRMLDRNIPVFNHHTSYYHPTAQLEKGVIIYPNSCIDQEVKIGEGTLINNSVTISHNTSIGKSCFIAPGVVICGNVKIGDHCFIGASCVISNDVVIGDNCMISIGSTITKDIPSGYSFYKNKIIEGNFNLY